MAAVLTASGLVPDGAGDMAVPFAATVSGDVPEEVAGAAVLADDAVVASADGVLVAAVLVSTDGELVSADGELVEEVLVEDEALSGPVDAVSTGLLQAASAAVAVIASAKASFFMEFLSR